MRDEFESAILAAIPGCRINGAGAERLPNTTNLVIPGSPSDLMLANMPLLCISSGSACNSGVMEGSFVLRQMGLSAEEAASSLRVSGSILTSSEELMRAVSMIVTTSQHIRSMAI